MEDIVNWLLEMEQLACMVYRAAAEKHSEDKDFSSFLSSMAEDEDLHYQLIQNAKQQLLNKKIHPEPIILIDQDLKDRNKTPLLDLYECINSSDLSKHAILKLIVETEYLEWNNIFMYVVNTFQAGEREVQHVAAKIQAHEKRIEEFLDRYSSSSNLSNLIQKLPSIWKQKILIVDDAEPIRVLFSKILKDVASAETAENGLEGLEKIKDSFFDVIISDVKMPIMDGIEFFQRATKIDPNIRKYFMFCSGNITADLEALCLKHDLTLLEKPFTIQKLRSVVHEILARNK